MAGYDPERDEQARIISKALDECPKKMAAVAWGMGVEPDTFQKWKLGHHRFPMSKIFALARSLGSIDFLNRLARRHGFVVVELPAIDDAAELAQQINHLNIAGNRAAAAVGKVVGRIADATDVEGPGGESITAEEFVDIELAMGESIATNVSILEYLRGLVSKAN